MDRRLFKLGRAGIHTIVSDLGKKQDSTINGIFRTRVIEKEGYRQFFVHELVYLIKSPKMSWPDLLIAMEKLVNLPGLVPAPGLKVPMLILDAQGGGDVFNDFARDRGIHTAGVLATSGDTESYDKESNIHNVSKGILAKGLVRNVEKGVLRVAGTLSHRKELEKELENYSAKIKKSGMMTYENSKDSVHDDMVSMLTLGNYWLTYQYRSELFQYKKRVKKEEYDMRKNFVSRRRR